MAVVAVAGDDLVAVLRGHLDPDHHGLLADIEVAEAADQAHAVELAGLLLEAADQQHLAIGVQVLVAAEGRHVRGRGRRGRLLAVLSLPRRASFAASIGTLPAATFVGAFLGQVAAQIERFGTESRCRDEWPGKGRGSGQDQGVMKTTSLGWTRPSTTRPAPPGGRGRSGRCARGPRAAPTRSGRPWCVELLLQAVGLDLQGSLRLEAAASALGLVQEVADHEDRHGVEAERQTGRHGRDDGLPCGEDEPARLRKTQSRRGRISRAPGLRPSTDHSVSATGVRGSVSRRIRGEIVDDVGSRLVITMPHRRMNALAFASNDAAVAKLSPHSGEKYGIALAGIGQTGLDCSTLLSRPALDSRRGSEGCSSSLP